MALLLPVTSGQSFAHKVWVHQAMTLHAVQRATLMRAGISHIAQHASLPKPANSLTDIGPIDGLPEDLTKLVEAHFYEPSGAKYGGKEHISPLPPLSSTGLICAGSILEDRGVRPVWHFCKPAGKSGDYEGVLIYPPTTKWIDRAVAEVVDAGGLTVDHAEYKPQQAALALRLRNAHSVQNLMNYLANAWLEESAERRLWNLHSLCLGLGSLAHLCQDQTQPSHSRADAHGDDLLTGSSALEKWEGDSREKAMSAMGALSSVSSTEAAMSPRAAITECAQLTSGRWFSDETWNELPSIPDGVTRRRRPGELRFAEDVWSKDRLLGVLRFPKGAPKFELTSALGQDTYGVLRAQLHDAFKVGVPASSKLLNWFFRAPIVATVQFVPASRQLPGGDTRHELSIDVTPVGACFPAETVGWEVRVSFGKKSFRGPAVAERRTCGVMHLSAPLPYEFAVAPGSTSGAASLEVVVVYAGKGSDDEHVVTGTRAGLGTVTFCPPADERYEKTVRVDNLWQRETQFQSSCDLIDVKASATSEASGKLVERGIEFQLAQTAEAVSRRLATAHLSMKVCGADTPDTPTPDSRLSPCPLDRALPEAAELPNTALPGALLARYVWLRPGEVLTLVGVANARVSEDLVDGAPYDWAELADVTSSGSAECVPRMPGTNDSPDVTSAESIEGRGRNQLGIVLSLSRVDSYWNEPQSMGEVPPQVFMFADDSSAPTQLKGIWTYHELAGQAEAITAHNGTLMAPEPILVMLQIMIDQFAMSPPQLGSRRASLSVALSVKASKAAEGARIDSH